MSRKYDVAIIGAGPGGYTSAIRLSQAGKSVCVIDINEGRLGGTCLNEGCIPVKSLLNIAKVFSVMKKAGDCGIEADLKSPDMNKVIACSQNAVLQLQNGLKGLFRKYKIEFIAGTAKLISPNKIDVELKSGEREGVEAGKIIIATGSSAKVPQDIDVDGKIILTSAEAIKLKRIPKTLLVMGAGSIGVEVSSAFDSFGTKITLVEMAPNILPFEDEEISRTLTRILKKKGMNIFTGTKIKALRKKAASAEAVLETGGVEKKMDFECVLIAIGRKPNTGGMGLEETGVKLQNGFIATDEKMRTNIDSVYAVGDVVNTPMYAHVAYKEGLLAAEDIMGGKIEPINYENVPNVLFSEPQVASLGLTEARARERETEITVSKRFFKANGMAVAARRDEGFIKIIADKETHRIIGVHIIGGDATEILHEFVVAKNSKLTVDDIANAMHAHPTFSEIAADAAKAIFDTEIP